MTRIPQRWKYRSLLWLDSLRGWCLPVARRHYRLAILKVDQIGDAVVSLGAIRRLTAAVGEEHTLLVVSSSAQSLFQTEFPRASLLVLPTVCPRFWPDFVRLVWREGARFRGVSAEDLVCLRNHQADYLHALARLIPVKRIVASRIESAHFGQADLPFPPAELAPYPPRGGNVCRELEAHRRVVSLALGEDVALSQVVPVLERPAVPVRNTLLVCPEAGHPIREYPREQLAAAIAGFVKGHPIAVEFSIPPQSDPTLWSDALTAAGLTDITWRRPASVAELVETIGGAGLVLTMESGPAHIAAAFDKPLVAITGGGDFETVAPWSRSDRQIWLFERLDCFYCGWNCIHDAAVCITGIAPAQVTAALCRLLDPRVLPVVPPESSSGTVRV